MKTISTLYRMLQNDDYTVVVDSRPLPLRLDLRNHSPTGFAHGYGGSGPAQLALAILADFLGDDRKALAFYQPFKWRIIAQLPRDKAWTLTGAQILAAVEALEQEMKGNS